MDSKVIDNDDFLKVYKLEAIDLVESPDGSTSLETMLIGFFNSAESCDTVEDEYKNLPGFCLPSCKFKKTPYVFSSTEQLNIERVFYVQACIIAEFTGEEKITEIGVFLSQDAADAAKEQYINESNMSISLGQKEESDAIYIDEYDINQRHWKDGFTRYVWMPEKLED